LCPFYQYGAVEISQQPHYTIIDYLCQSFLIDSFYLTYEADFWYTIKRKFSVKTGAKLFAKFSEITKTAIYGACISINRNILYMLV